MNKPDWTVAPEGAQFYSCRKFRKHEGRIEFFWDDVSGWIESSFDTMSLHKDVFGDFEMHPEMDEPKWVESNKPLDMPTSFYKLALYDPDGSCVIVNGLNADNRLVEKMIAVHESHTKDNKSYSTPTTQPEWSEGDHPPVGTVCDYICDEQGRFVDVKVEHYTSDGKSVVIQDGEEYYVKSLLEIEFRPC